MLVMSEVKITYETLFDLLRREKNRNELQPLDESFYQDVIHYLKEKKESLQDSEEKSTYSDPERDKIKTQIENIKKILRELYELREKKILHLAMDKVRTESQLIDTSPLLEEEKKFYDEACQLLDKYKEGILLQVRQGNKPLIETGKDYDEKIEQQQKNENPAQKKERKRREEKEKRDKQEKKAKNDKKKEDEKMTVTILHDLPKFVGLDKEIYGPYEKDEDVTLPKDVANLLIEKGRAKKE